jgi:ubiquinone/menaquinone biosynthesis C-methylase UbiE
VGRRHSLPEDREVSGTDPTTRFGDRAQAYVAHRPSYPQAVFAALLDGLGAPRELDVADVGAGTGISAALLAARVRRVVAIEPNAAMRALAPALENVEWRDATAERTGLADKSVDVAAAFQAFHWFDPEQALREFARIARERIGIVQYERDERDAFTRAYGDAIRPFMTDDTEAIRLHAMEAFAQRAGASLRRSVVPSSQSLTEEGLLGRAASASYLPQTGANADRLRERLRELFRDYRRDGSVEMKLCVFVLTRPAILLERCERS